jgi:cytochrome c556
MDEADDEDYARLSRQMTQAAATLTAALDRGDLEAVGKAPSVIRQRCDDCHAEYR